MTELPRPSRILFADDDAYFRRPLAELLRRKGCECVQVEDGAAAMAALRDQEFDLLLTDINMPGNGALELVEALAAAAPGLPVIVLTGHPQIETAAASVRLPVVAYLTKPPKFDELWRVAAGAMARRRDCQDVSASRRRLLDWARELEQLEEDMKGTAPKFDDGSAELWSALVFRQAWEGLLDLRRLAERRAGETAAPSQSSAALTQAIEESIAVLEQTKQSFKSKRLADLRRHLEAVLEKRPAEPKNASVA